MIIPFVNKIRKWVQKKKKQLEKERKQRPSNEKNKRNSSISLEKASAVLPPPPDALLSKLSHAVNDYQGRVAPQRISDQAPLQMVSGREPLAIPSVESRNPLTPAKRELFPPIYTLGGGSGVVDPWRNFKFNREEIYKCFKIS